jgi:hypothetical protein
LSDRYMTDPRRKPLNASCDWEENPISEVVRERPKIIAWMK